MKREVDGKPQRQRTTGLALREQLPMRALSRQVVEQTCAGRREGACPRINEWVAKRLCYRFIKGTHDALDGQDGTGSRARE